MSSNSNSSNINILKSSAELLAHNKSDSIDSFKELCPYISNNLLKKINHLKYSSNFVNRAKKSNDSLKSFHSNFLRESIHRSKQYKSLFSKNIPIKDSNLPELVINGKRNISSENSTCFHTNTISSFTKTNNLEKYIKYNKSNINRCANFPSLLGKIPIPLKSTKKLSITSTNILKNQNIIQTNNSINKNFESYESISDNINENDLEYIYELNKNKTFRIELNPAYSKLKKELLNEFMRKVRYLEYEKYNLFMLKKDVLNEKERQKTELEQENLNYNNYSRMLTYFNSFNKSYASYIYHMNKQIVEEKKVTKELIEKKVTLMNEIYALRYKILRLENKFHGYLNDKYFLLSVKNHSIELDKFCEADRENYSKDLKKLEILNIVLEKTANQSLNDSPDENAIKNSRNRKKTKKTFLSQTKKDHENSELNSKNIRNIHLRNTSDKKKPSIRKTFVKEKTIIDKPYLLTTTQKQLITTNFKAIPIYEDTADFNHDLEQTKRNIQFSLIEYNKRSKEIHSLIDELVKTKTETKNIENLYLYFQKEIENAEKKLEKIKLQNLNMKKLKDYIWIIANSNLNKGKVNKKLKEILNNIYQAGDNKIKEFLKAEKYDELQKIKILESLAIYLIDVKEEQKAEHPIAFSNVIKKVNSINRVKLFQMQLKNAEEEFENKIKKVIDKENKIYYIHFSKPNYGVNRIKTHHKKKITKKKKIDIFDFDII